jgi:hypothetical protein
VRLEQVGQLVILVLQAQQAQRDRLEQLEEVAQQVLLVNKDQDLHLEANTTVARNITKTTLLHIKVLHGSVFKQLMELLLPKILGGQFLLHKVQLAQLVQLVRLVE